MRDKNIRDLLAGLLMLAVGLFFALYGSRYSFGTTARMGPGYFPVVLGWVLAALGVLIALPALRQPHYPMSVQWGNLWWVTLALALFAFTLPLLGLAPAGFIAALVGSVADRSLRWPTRLLIAAVVSVLTVLIFKYGLGMILPVWWWNA